MEIFTTSLQWKHLFEPFSIILNVIERKNLMKCVHEKLIEMLASIRNYVSFNLDRSCATTCDWMIFAFLIYEDAATPNLHVWIFTVYLIELLWFEQNLFENWRFCIAWLLTLISTTTIDTAKNELKLNKITTTTTKYW